MVVAAAPLVDHAVPVSPRRAPLPVVPALELDPERTSLRIVSWSSLPGRAADEEDAHDPRSTYVERFWLGILGPSTTWLLRSLAYGFDGAPDGFDLDILDTARVLGRMTWPGLQRRARASLPPCRPARP